MDFRIVLLGLEGSGKSATGNTILGSQQFNVTANSDGGTKKCTTGRGTIFNHKVLVVETPGWGNTELSEVEIVKQMNKSIEISYPGPNVFLLIVPIGRFTKEQIEIVRKIEMIFGEQVTRFMIVLFTHGDDLDGKKREHFLRDATRELNHLIVRCGGECHVFNNKEKSSQDQVHKLLEMIQAMVKRNKGQCYTNKLMYCRAQQPERGEPELKVQTPQVVKPKMCVKQVHTHTGDLTWPKRQPDREKPTVTRPKPPIKVIEQRAVSASERLKMAQDLTWKETIKELERQLQEKELEWREKYNQVEKERDDLQYQLKLAEINYKRLQQQIILEEEWKMASRNLTAESNEYKDRVDKLERRHHEERDRLKVESVTLNDINRNLQQMEAILNDKSRQPEEKIESIRKYVSDINRQVTARCSIS